jgi:3-oxoacyl-[acyl-carrier protein] reductase
MKLGLADRACVVTGASSGIGLATARGLMQEGARVLLVARGEAGLADAEGRLLAGLQAEAGRCATCAADVTEPGAAERVLAACRERLGDADVLVNNAGTSSARALDELSDEEWDAQWQTNVVAPMRFMRVFAKDMAGRGWGRIVNVCSSAAVRTSLTNVAYSVSKAGELELTRVFADDYAERGVVINAVLPGAVATPLWTGTGGLADQIAGLRGITRDAAVAAQSTRTTIGRLSEPEEVAAVVTLLCSGAARAAQGAAWPVGFAG